MNEKEKRRSEELADKRIKDATTAIAKCLNMLEMSTQEVRWACESQGWNDEVAYLIDEASTKLGFALATLVRWNDSPDESEKC